VARGRFPCHISIVTMVPGTIYADYAWYYAGETVISVTMVPGTIYAGTIYADYAWYYAGETVIGKYATQRFCAPFKALAQRIFAFVVWRSSVNCIVRFGMLFAI
jgi:hypothetical protein